MSKTISSTFAIRKFVTQSGTDGAGWSSTSAVTLTFPRIRTGDSCPGWKQKIANHQSATTALSGSNAELISYDPAAITLQVLGTAYAPSYKRSVKGCATYPATLYSAAGTSYTDVDNRAKARFYSECNKAVSEFGGGEFFGELRETVQMLRRPLSAIRDHMGRYLDHCLALPDGRRGRKSFRKFRQAEKLRLIGATWLEYRFGLRTLIKDVNTILSEVGKIVDVVQYIPVKAWEESEDQSYYTTTRRDPWAGSHIFVIHNERKISKTKVIYTGEVKIEGAAPGLAGFVSSKMHLDLEHFIPTLWELAPLSWLVDYFTNVGDVINSIFLLPKNLAWYQRTVRRSCINEATATLDLAYMRALWGKQFGGVTGSAGSMVIETSSVLRGVPPLTWVTPELKLPDYHIQFANMGALLASSKLLSEKLASLSR